MAWQSLVGIVLAVAAAQSEVVEKRFPDGTVRLRSEVRAVDGAEPILHGKQTRFFPDGKTAKEMTYVDGLKDGPWTEWLANGSKLAEGRYAKNLKEGLETSYLSNGEKVTETHFLGGVRHGKH